MSLDPARLRHAFGLALDGPAPAASEAAHLAHLLAVPEEVLPHLVLKRAAFGTSPKIRAALAATAARAAAARPSRAAVSIEDATRIAARDVDLDRALTAVVGLQVREAATLEGAEAALRERVQLSPPVAYDAHLRIRLRAQD